MAFINENYLKLPGSYLFSEIARRVDNFRKENPNAKIIRLGIGDVTKRWRRQLLTLCTKRWTKWQKRRLLKDTDRSKVIAS